MNLRRKILSYRLAVFLRIGTVLSISLVYVVIGFSSRNFNVLKVNQEERGFRNGRSLLASVGVHNCTPAAIQDFPSDGFTREQRQQGAAILHALLACYFFILMGIVCENYFVPAVKSICTNLEMREDITGATFMAVAGSSSELFINCIGTFITEGDIGVGTIVGSAVFNVLAVPACCGLFANMVLQLEWWPVTRDSVMYGVSVIMLIKILEDERVYLKEAIILVSGYLFYIAIMYFNENITNAITRLRRLCRTRRHKYQEMLNETHPLLMRCQKNGSVSFIPAKDLEITLKDCEELVLEESTNIWKWPKHESSSRKLFWFITWPISLLLYLTIPDCRKYPRLTPLTFIMCILWIGITSYIVAWLITIIGDTLDIPDSVMGLTFLAAGTSVPEAVSSIIVTNQGHGAMGVSSSIGSNTFDILLCLGLPWLLKTAVNPKDSHSIVINSSGLTYSAFSLFGTLICFYFSLLINKFRLDWKIGIFCLILYVAFLVSASLIELNVFFPVNLPTCDR